MNNQLRNGATRLGQQDRGRAILAHAFHDSGNVSFASGSKSKVEPNAKAPII